ncbi:Mob1/phocein [Phakopsora pachyrhizi]|uniref:Mob1/phocein n=1 Tax=Phakopsora pachyrhizi TaxID=170000 RepID=A0AAV0APP7_PHAPC|nr:Mob1/phocein [Phakopsora pachyrhizi]KAI8453921.1 Mob1/phocein [Phakopsora pachyrhizi]CAH7669352.1 Mob1/phocein [Phakopsora pachyrhizi]
MSFLNRVGIKSSTNPNQQQLNSTSNSNLIRSNNSPPSEQQVPSSNQPSNANSNSYSNGLQNSLSGLTLSSGNNQLQRALTPSGPSGKALYLCNPFVKAALVKGSFRTIVSLPRYCDVNEWVAVNLVDFFHNLNLFLSISTECCTGNSCPTMSAGQGMDYTWTSMTGGTKKQVKVPAPQYIDYVMTWAEKLLADEGTFPTKAGREFNQSNFPSSARHLYTQFLRIFAHLYHAHFDHFIHLSSEGHLNSLFAHFLQFGAEFDLIEQKELRAPKENVPFVVGDLLDAWKSMGILSC